MLFVAWFCSQYPNARKFLSKFLLACGYQKLSFFHLFLSRGKELHCTTFSPWGTMTENFVSLPSSPHFCQFPWKCNGKQCFLTCLLHFYALQSGCFSLLWRLPWPDKFKAMFQFAHVDSIIFIFYLSSSVRLIACQGREVLLGNEVQYWQARGFGLNEGEAVHVSSR